MTKWIALIALGTSMLVVLGAEADAAEASYRPVGKVYGLKVQAGKDTSAAMARKMVNAGLSRPCDGSFTVRSPVTGRSYRIRCLYILRYGYTSNPRDGWTVPVWGGLGDNGSRIRARAWLHGQAS
jgi:hypothetical protein